ncbi:MAG: hypothetical protein AAGA62_12015 [Bacteroidota bacterium]
MLSFPTFRQLSTPTERLQYAAQYEACSGLPVPSDYLLSKENQVFGIFYQKTLIGGFLLGFGQDSRTVRLFARSEAQANVLDALGCADNYSELCCLWLARKYRATFLINTFTWLIILYALLRFANPCLVFGTCSRGLARLYASSKRVHLLHEDVINRKPTYIFTGQKHNYLVGILNILLHKYSRKLRLGWWRWRLKWA